MVTITKDEFEQLQQYEADLRRAFKAKYKLPCPREEENYIVSLVRKYEPQRQINRSCPNCMFKVFERVGMWYYAYLEAQPKVEEKPKRTRKKKEDEVCNLERPEQDNKK